MPMFLSFALTLILMTTTGIAQTIPKDPSKTASTAPSSHSAVIDPAKRAMILKFLDVFGTRKALTDNLDRVIKQIPAENAQDALKMRDRIKVDEIIDELVPIYDNHFSLEELKAYINFYDSPDGRKLLEEIPVLMLESVEISSKYMEKKFPEMKQGS